MSKMPIQRRGTSTLVRLCRVLSHESRRRILLLLGEEPMDVTTIARRAGLPPDVASHQLSWLYDLDLVEIEARGKWRLYRLTNSVSVRRAAGSETLTLRAPDGVTVSLRSAKN